METSSYYIPDRILLILSEAKIFELFNQLLVESWVIDDLRRHVYTLFQVIPVHVINTAWLTEQTKSWLECSVTTFHEMEEDVVVALIWALLDNSWFLKQVIQSASTHDIATLSVKDQLHIFTESWTVVIPDCLWVPEWFEHWVTLDDLLFDAYFMSSRLLASTVRWQRCQKSHTLFGSFSLACTWLTTDYNGLFITRIHHLFVSKCWDRVNMWLHFLHYENTLRLYDLLVALNYFGK